MNGPLTSWPATSNIINADVWDQIPTDLQQIFIEEGARTELEQLRLAAIQNLVGVQDNIDTGMVMFVEFSPEIRRHSYNVAVQHVIPGWLNRLDSARGRNDALVLFNENVGPYVGLLIGYDGTVEIVPITKGPYAGKTMEQVLSE